MNPFLSCNIIDNMTCNLGQCSSCSFIKKGYRFQLRMWDIFWTCSNAALFWVFMQPKSCYICMYTKRQRKPTRSTFCVEQAIYHAFSCTNLHLILVLSHVWTCIWYWSRYSAQFILCCNLHQCSCYFFLKRIQILWSCCWCVAEMGIPGKINWRRVTDREEHLQRGASRSTNRAHHNQWKSSWHYFYCGLTDQRKTIVERKLD